MTDVLIKRELLERAIDALEGRMCIGCHGDICCMPAARDASAELRAILAAPRQPACDECGGSGVQIDDHCLPCPKCNPWPNEEASPRQPEGEGLEVVGYRCWFKKEPESIMAGWGIRMPSCPNPHAEYEELCRLSDAQRAIAELRGLVPELPPRTPEGEGMPRYGLRWNGPQQPVAVPMDDGYWTPWHLAEAERDTLRQQLAERDAAIEEWSGTAVQNGMECDRLRQQRDRLAGLLADLAGAARSVNHGPQHALKVDGDDDPVFPQRGEWVEWLKELGAAADAALAEVSK